MYISATVYTYIYIQLQIQLPVQLQVQFPVQFQVQLQIQLRVQLPVLYVAVAGQAGKFTSIRRPADRDFFLLRD